MQFGIYPSSITGSDKGPISGKPDDPQAIMQALNELQGDTPSFWVRAYVHYKGNGQSANETPVRPAQYLTSRRRLDLVLCYQTNDADMEDWCKYIEQVITEYGDQLGTLQITEETNAKGVGTDGDFPPSLQALVRGVVAAKLTAIAAGLDTKIGFNATPSFNPADTYWQELRSLATPAFYDALDYVGIDFFPDVFRPVPVDELEGAVRYVLTAFRKSLEAAGISTSVPLHITENGWPTGKARPLKDQASVLEKIIRTIYAMKDELTITHYELFQLRDAITSDETLFSRFGLLDDNYKAKPAFNIYKALVAELSATDKLADFTYKPTL
jgi:hypothetical protein